MTRTGTVALSRIAFLAALVCGPAVAHAQRATQPARTSGEWEAQRADESESSSRRDEAAAASWKPSRNERSQSVAAARPKSAPRKSGWFPISRRALSSQPPIKRSHPLPPIRRSFAAPNPFVPPADAQQLTASPRPVVKHSTAAQTSAPAARTSAEPASAARMKSRTTDQRVSYRPKPTPTANRPSMANRLMDDTWMGSLRQVAFQAGEPEELYAPPGEELPSPMPGGPMPRGPMMSGPTMDSQMQGEGEWIGAPDDACCDGSCGPDCDCGPMCGDGVGCCSTL